MAAVFLGVALFLLGVLVGRLSVGGSSRRRRVVRRRPGWLRAVPRDLRSVVYDPKSFRRKR